MNKLEQLNRYFKGKLFYTFKYQYRVQQIKYEQGWKKHYYAIYCERKPRNDERYEGKHLFNRVKPKKGVFKGIQDIAYKYFNVDLKFGNRIHKFTQQWSQWKKT